ncbi:MAG: DUF167 family protein [Nitrospirales bacterium]|nr:DUF167 family protein [Nitrospirales bacterium]
MSEFISQTDQGIVLNVYIQPRASRTEYVGVHGNALKFRISAPPIEGLANEALCGYLAKELRISKGAVVIFSGHQARQKRVLLKGVSPEQVRGTLLKSTP